jgi:hypothetical protein
MDVDATEIDISTAKQVVRCFYCNNKGHIKKNCCKYQAAQERERGLEKEKPPRRPKPERPLLKKIKKRRKPRKAH